MKENFRNQKKESSFTDMMMPACLQHLHSPKRKTTCIQVAGALFEIINWHFRIDTGRAVHDAIAGRPCLSCSSFDIFLQLFSTLQPRFGLSFHDLERCRSELLLGSFQVKMDLELGIGTIFRVTATTQHSAC